MEFDKIFELKEEHIKLLNSMWVNWHEGYSELGTPVIDLKGPYGNGDVVEDIYEILEGESINEDELFVKYKELHRETETALQIVLQTKSFETGNYGLIGWGKAWVKIK